MGEEGDAYYTAAQKRLGLVEPGIAAGQCYMLSGIYLMYTVQPLRAWSSFHQAGSAYSLYLRCQAASRISTSGRPMPPTTTVRRFEQRLYWTVLKSECEMRAELDLPQSALCKVAYPDLFPSPPTPSSPAESPLEHLSHQTPMSTTTPHSSTSTNTLHNLEQQSWFYYMSEIALRRIENRVLNAFYKQKHHHWTNIADMINAANQVEAQLDAW